MNGTGFSWRTAKGMQFRSAGTLASAKNARHSLLPAILFLQTPALSEQHEMIVQGDWRSLSRSQYSLAG